MILNVVGAADNRFLYKCIPIIIYFVEIFGIIHSVSSFLNILYLWSYKSHRILIKHIYIHLGIYCIFGRVVIMFDY